MKILFITLLDIRNVHEKGIYQDLLRKFLGDDHEVFIVSPVERKYNKKTYVIDVHKNCKILKVKTGNMQKTNVIEKGISTLLLENQILTAIKKYFGNIKFDLILYSTPPITFLGAIKYVKRRDSAKTYLLLKDIFPQNAVDLDFFSKRSMIYHYFRNKEKELYAISDYIGCMSPANVKYLLENNEYISPSKVHVCPNSIEIENLFLEPNQKKYTRKKYDIPQDKYVLVYGGNLGKPQGIEFLMQCLKKEKNNKEVFFVIIGDGTEYRKLQNFLETEKPKNVKLNQYMEKREFEQLVASCDAGMIFLDYRFTIPNYPSRILSYMQAGLPILVASDLNTDIGHMVEEKNIGVWCRSNDVLGFSKSLKKICLMNVPREKVVGVLKQCFDVNDSYQIIKRCVDADSSK